MVLHTYKVTFIGPVGKGGVPDYRLVQAHSVALAKQQLMNSFKGNIRITGAAIHEWRSDSRQKKKVTVWKVGKKNFIIIPSGIKQVDIKNDIRSRRKVNRDGVWRI